MEFPVRDPSYKVNMTAHRLINTRYVCSKFAPFNILSGQGGRGGEGRGEANL